MKNGQSQPLYTIRLLKTLIAGCSKRSQRQGARGIGARRRTAEYVDERRWSATKPMSLFQQPASLDRPTVLRQIDGIAVGIVDAEFSLTVGRPLVDTGRRVKLVAGLTQGLDVFDLETEVINARF